MKKAIYLLMMLMVLSLGSCKKNEAQETKETSEQAGVEAVDETPSRAANHVILKEGIAEMQGNLPIDLGTIGKIKSMVYDDAANVVIATVDYNDDLIGINSIRDNIESAKENMLMALANNDMFKSLIVDANASLKYVYVAKSNGEKVEVTLTPDDFKQSDKYKNMSAKDRARKIVETNILSSKAMMPMTVDEYTTLTDIKLDGDKVTYIYKVDDSTIVSISLMRENADAIKQQIKSGIYSDLTVRQTMSNVRSAGYDLVYKYIGKSSGDVLTITFKNSELPQ